MFNLAAFAQIARVGDRRGVDLWNFRPDHGGGLKKSIQALLPYISGEKEWQHPQIHRFTVSRFTHRALRLYARQFGADILQVMNRAPLEKSERDFSLIVVGDHEAVEK